MFYVPFSREARRCKEIKATLNAARVFVLSHEYLAEYREGRFAAQFAALDAAIALYVGDTTKKGKPTFDTTHPSKAGARRYAELFLADVKARELSVASLFK